MKPQEIEDLSFKIIEQEAGDHGFDEMHWPIVRRMIHTSALVDLKRPFEYLFLHGFNRILVHNR